MHCILCFKDSWLGGLNSYHSGICAASIPCLFGSAAVIENNLILIILNIPEIPVTRYTNVIFHSSLF